MPIVFNEGLPRSGKSYSALVDYIIPALQKGRRVSAHISGLNHEQIALVSDVPLTAVRELLGELSAEDVMRLPTLAVKDSLIVIDEVQNYFPNSRQKLDAHWVKFISEHGHLGIDVLLLGQDMRDVHAIWRRRVTQKTCFLKMEGVGAAGRYQWAVHKATAPEKFKLVSQSSMSGAVYDAKYFGCYSSFDDGTENKSGTLYDKRAVLWQTSVFKVWLPVALVAGIVGLWYMLRVFSPGSSNPMLEAQRATVAKSQGIQGTVRPNRAEVPDPVAHAVPAQVATTVAPRSTSEHGVDLKAAVRLVGVVTGIGADVRGFVEFQGEEGGIVSFETLRALGWVLALEGGVLRASQGGSKFVAYSFRSREMIRAIPAAVGTNGVPASPPMSGALVAGPAAPSIP